MTTSPDIKPRSRDVTDGLEKAAARGMLRAVGLGDDDFAKPQIGVATRACTRMGTPTHGCLI